MKTEFQAEELARVMQEQNASLATKGDLAILKSELEHSIKGMAYKLIITLSSVVVVCIGICTTILGFIIHTH
jgi:hypothetical protein